MSMCVWAKLLQSCQTLHIPMDCSLTGSSAHGILQARTRKWVSVSSSRGSSRPRDPGGFLPLAPPGKPINGYARLQNVPFLLPSLLCLGNSRWKQRAYLQPEEMLHPNSFSFIHLNIYWAPSTCQSIKCKVLEGIFFREGCFLFFFLILK